MYLLDGTGKWRNALTNKTYKDQDGFMLTMSYDDQLWITESKHESTSGRFNIKCDYIPRKAIICSPNILLVDYDGMIIAYKNNEEYISCIIANFHLIDAKIHKDIIFVLGVRNGIYAIAHLSSGLEKVLLLRDNNEHKYLYEDWVYNKNIGIKIVDDVIQGQFVDNMFTKVHILSFGKTVTIEERTIPEFNPDKLVARIHHDYHSLVVYYKETQTAKILLENSHVEISDCSRCKLTNDVLIFTSNGKYHIINNKTFLVPILFEC